MFITSSLILHAVELMQNINLYNVKSKIWTTGCKMKSFSNDFFLMLVTV